MLINVSKPHTGHWLLVIYCVSLKSTRVCTISTGKMHVANMNFICEHPPMKIEVETVKYCLRQPRRMLVRASAVVELQKWRNLCLVHVVFIQRLNENYYSHRVLWPTKINVRSCTIQVCLVLFICSMRNDHNLRLIN